MKPTSGVPSSNSTFGKQSQEPQSTYSKKELEQVSGELFDQMLADVLQVNIIFLTDFVSFIYCLKSKKKIYKCFTQNIDLMRGTEKVTSASETLRSNIAENHVDPFSAEAAEAEHPELDPFAAEAAEAETELDPFAAEAAETEHSEIDPIEAESDYTELDPFAAEATEAEADSLDSTLPIDPNLVAVVPLSPARSSAKAARLTPSKSTSFSFEFEGVDQTTLPWAQSYTAARAGNL